jgi:hypothetical protein
MSDEPFTELIEDLNADKVKEEAPFALKGHSHTDLTGEFEGTFRKIKIVNGIVTEFELE